MSKGFATARSFAGAYVVCRDVVPVQRVGARAGGCSTGRGLQRAHPGPAPEGRAPARALRRFEEDALRFSVSDGNVLAGLHLPPGKPVTLYLLAEDSTGVLRFEGKAEITVKEGIEAPHGVRLESLLGEVPAELTFASHRLVLEFAGIGDEKNLSTGDGAAVRCGWRNRCDQAR